MKYRKLPKKAPKWGFLEDELLSPSNPYPNFGGIFARVSIQLLCYCVLAVAKMALEEKKERRRTSPYHSYGPKGSDSCCSPEFRLRFLAYLLEKLSSKSEAFVH